MHTLDTHTHLHTHTHTQTHPHTHTHTCRHHTHTIRCHAHTCHHQIFIRYRTYTIKTLAQIPGTSDNRYTPHNAHSTPFRHPPKKGRAPAGNYMYQACEILNHLISVLRGTPTDPPCPFCHLGPCIIVRHPSWLGSMPPSLACMEKR